MTTMECGWYECPHCGESVDTSPDPGGGLEQEYVEDCPVCCRPNQILAVFSPDEDGYRITASGEI
jgi:hypothetical protein